MHGPRTGDFLFGLGLPQWGLALPDRALLVLRIMRTRRLDLPLLSSSFRRLLR